MFNVDVDEADIAVLTQNITRSKELFAEINTSLLTISAKTQSASRTIKPVFAEINALNAKKASVEDGISLLQDVSEYSSKAADAQRTLSTSIDSVGVTKYLNCLQSSMSLLRDMKRDIKDFDGVLIGYANAVDKAEMNVIAYFSRMFTSVDLETGKMPNIADANAVLSFFAKQKNLRSAHESIERSFAMILTEKLGPLEAACAAHRKQANIPYERGSNGINKLVKHALRLIQGMKLACESLQIQGSPVLRNTVASYMETRFVSVIFNYNAFVDSNGVAGQDLLLLDVLDNLRLLDESMRQFSFGFDSFPKTKAEHAKLVSKAQGLLTEWVRYVETRVSSIERFNEHSIPEVVVEVVSRIRRICDFDSLSDLLEGKKLGSWLNIKPALKFITVYTSVVPGAEAQEEDQTSFMVSSFLSDLIDELMVNLEIGLKEQSGEGGLRKSTQGFMLVKNLVMVETIVNRSESLYARLGHVGLERLTRLKNRFLKAFLDDWNYASYVIIRDMTQITTTNALHGGQSSAKEKEQIKDVFKTFNESFEEALKQYEKFNIQEKDLRAYLGSEIKKLILNAYNKLYDKYGSGDFTKNKAKYVKYDKLQLEKLLNERL